PGPPRRRRVLPAARRRRRGSVARRATRRPTRRAGAPRRARSDGEASAGSSGPPTAGSGGSALAPRAPRIVGSLGTDREVGLAALTGGGQGCPAVVAPGAAVVRGPVRGPHDGARAPGGPRRGRR